MIRPQNATEVKVSGALGSGGVFMTHLARFLRNEDGATAIEYGLILTGIALVIITAVSSIGTNLAPIFTKAASNLK